jgi:hypothetical protein
LLILVGATAPLDQEALQPPPRMTSRIEEQTVPSLRSSRVQAAPANHPQNEAVALISFGFPPVASVPPLDLGIRAEVLDTGSSIRAVHEPCGSASFAFVVLAGRCKRAVPCSGIAPTTSRVRRLIRGRGQGLPLGVQSSWPAFVGLRRCGVLGGASGFGGMSGGGRRSGHDNSQSSRKSPAKAVCLPGTACMGADIPVMWQL